MSEHNQEEKQRAFSVLHGFTSHSQGILTRLVRGHTRVGQTANFKLNPHQVRVQPESDSYNSLGVVPPRSNPSAGCWATEGTCVSRLRMTLDGYLGNAGRSTYSEM